LKGGKVEPLAQAFEKEGKLFGAQGRRGSTPKIKGAGAQRAGLRRLVHLA
jgi:hypothetical protein